MAVLENLVSGEKLILFSQHSIGRDNNKRFTIDESDVSRNHAIIHWENGSWYLTDFSSNGTLINGNQISRTSQKLRQYDTIQFSANKTTAWKLIDIDQPSSFLKSKVESDSYIELKEGIIFLVDNAARILFRDSNLNWVINDDEGEKILVNGESCIIENREYIFVENEYLEDTRRNMDVSKNVSLKMYLSGDEEDVSAQIHINDLVLDLGTRAFNHLLLQLVRVRKRDDESGLNEPASGWISSDELIQALSKEVLKDVDDYYINNLIYRLRKYLMTLQPYGYLFANIIERKRGKLRLGLSNFEIIKEDVFV